MKKSKVPFGCIVLLSFILFSCNDHFEGPPISQVDIFTCYRESEWDSIKIRNALIGNWEWEYISCYWNPEDAQYVHSEALSIEFRADSTLTVTQHGINIQISTWYVVDGDLDLFELEVEPFVDQLWGRILICGNRVEFNQSYADICDNYFKKKE